MRHLSPLALAIAVFVLGCGDRQPVTAPNATDAPRFDISDGAHGPNGNDGFFFLPPMVKEPVTDVHYKDEAFHGGMQAHVNIWELPGATPCLLGTPFKFFAAAQIQVAEERYQVSWDTKERLLVDQKVYRVQVCVGDVELGYADIQHADNRSELKNVDTDEFVPLVDGRTLPIKFRIEAGALCQFDAVCTSTFVDADVGGTFYAADDGAAINFDPGDLPGDVVLTIERIFVPFGVPCVPSALATGFVFQQFQGCYRLTTAPDLQSFDPPGFTGQVEVAVCIDPNVPETVSENLLLYKFDEGEEVRQPEPIQPPFPFDCEGFSGTPPGPIGFAREAFQMLASGVSRLFGPRPLYAVDGGLGCILRAGDYLSTFFWGLGVTAEATAGDEQEALIGTAVPISPAVTVMTFHPDDPGEGEPENQPVEGVPVTFTVTGGGGTLRDATGAPHISVAVLTAANGVATLPTGWVWELGGTIGTNTLATSGPFVTGEDGPPVFSAEAIAADWIVESVTLAPSSFPNFMDLITYAIVVRNIGQTSTPATTLSFSTGAPGVAAQTLAVGTLAAGAAQTINTVPQTIGPPATYVGTATVDPSNGYPEINETNNAGSLTYTIGFPPDLTVVALAVAPLDPSVADALTLSAIVRNNGPGTARATELMIDFGGESVINAPRFPVPTLAPGATHQVSRPLGRQIAQTYISNAVADVNNATPEISEANNSFQLTFGVDDLIGSVADATGDATVSTVSPSPDLVSASIEVDGVNATLKVRFAAGTFSATTTYAGFHLDIDQNPATGSPGVDAGTNDDDIIGEDYLIAIGSAALDGQAEIFHFLTGGGFTRKTFGTVTVVTNGLDVTIPLAELGGDEGRMNFKVTVQSLLDPEVPSFTGIVDYMSNVGLPPAIVDKRLIIGSLGSSAWYAHAGRVGPVSGIE